MIVNMKRSATSEEIDHVIDRIKECGFQAHVVRGEERTIIGAIGSSGRRSRDRSTTELHPVSQQEQLQISHPFKLVSGSFVKPARLSMWVESRLAVGILGDHRRSPGLWSRTTNYWKQRAV